MSQFPHDEFVKEYIPELIGEYGITKAGETLSSEMREIDIFFIPQKPVPSTPQTLGLLGKLVQITCLFEVFRNPVEIHQIQECLGKLFDAQNKQRKEKRKNKEKITHSEIPFLWILTPTLANHKLEQFSATLDLNNYEEGVYLLPSAFHTGIVIIHQLPVNEETLWLRILGRGSIQEKVIEELKNLPVNHPHRDNIIELVLNLLTVLESNQKQGNNLPSEDRELIMKLSPIYLERLAEREQMGLQKDLQQRINKDKELIIRQLTRKLGTINPDLQLEVKALNIDDLEKLAEDLFDMNSVEDLQQWLGNF
jgi:Domain of unknown function (DUF4351)